ncbi:MAG TPA: DUF3037 domain-containing protein [Tahibacter sp.]|nr:DUF3037 domain-containing protein [Tahibacter sp.]
MTKVGCQYSIIRFLPNAEAGEFANVGVLLSCPSTGFFKARLLSPSATSRVLAFFDSLDARILRNVLTDVDKELARVGKLAADRYATQGSASVRRLFDDVVRPRESSLRFSPAGAVLSDDPATTLDELYHRLVAHEPAVVTSH